MEKYILRCVVGRMVRVTTSSEAGRLDEYCLMSSTEFLLPTSSVVSGGECVTKVILEPLRHCPDAQSFEQLYQRCVVGQVVPL